MGAEAMAATENLDRLRRDAHAHLGAQQRMSGQAPEMRLDSEENGSPAADTPQRRAQRLSCHEAQAILDAGKTIMARPSRFPGLGTFGGAFASHAPIAMPMATDRIAAHTNPPIQTRRLASFASLSVFARSAAAVEEMGR